MAGQLLNQLLWTAQDASGNPISGATLTFYLTGTSTPATVYTDAALTTPAGLAARTSDSAGRFNQLYFSEAVIYKCVLADASAVVIDTFDPFNFALPTDDTGAPGVQYLSELTGVLSGSAISVSAFNSALSTIAADPDPVELPAGTFTMSANGLVLKDRVPIRGQGKELTTLDWSALSGYATTGLMTATGTGPGTFLPLSSGAVKGRQSVAVTGTPSAFTARSHVMIRSTEYGPAQINDQDKVTWAATTAVAKGALFYANGSWFVVTTAGTTGATAPTASGNPVTDGSATLYAFSYGAIDNQVRRANSTAYTLGQTRISSGGYILVCVTAGTSASSEPGMVYTNTLSLITDGTAVWRLAGYYNSTKGELKPYGVDRVDGTTIYLNEPLEDDYPLSAGGQSYTVEIAPVTLAEIRLSDMTIKGNGHPAVGSMTAVNSGTALYYTTSEVMDVGIMAKWCILTLERVKFIDIEQFQIHAGCTWVKDIDCEYHFSSTHIESNQYGIYAHGATRITSVNPLDINSRHLNDGDGSSSTSEPAYRGIPGPILVTGSKSIGCWQSPVGNHRASRYLEVTNVDWTVLCAGWKTRCPNASLNGGVIRGPRFSSSNDYIAHDGLVTVYYNGGKTVIKGIRTEGGVYGLRVSNSDLLIGDIDIDMQIEGAHQYGARFGVADGDAMENIHAKLSISGTVTFDNVLIDGPMTGCSLDVKYDGGRKGLTSSNRKPLLTKCDFDIAGRDCTEEALDIYNMVGGRLGGGTRHSTTASGVINRVKDCIGVVIDTVTTVTANSFTGEGWKVQATTLGLSSYIHMADQIVYTASGVGGRALSVEANVSNSVFGRMITPHTDKISLGANSTNTAWDEPSHVQDAAYTMVRQDQGRTIVHTAAGAHTWNLPVSPEVDIGWWTIVANPGAGVVTIGRNGGTLRIAGAAGTADRTIAQYTVARITCVGANAYVIEESTGVA